MPFEVTPRDCTSCSHGYCVSYIREQSKKMKDRDTQYRLAQITAMACTFDSWLPGEEDCPYPGTQAIDDYLERLVANAKVAGATLEAKLPSVFGQTEKPFFLTEAQIGKVRGDIFEAVCRAILWNCSVRHTAKSNGQQFAVLSLGDNYDLRKLFTKESGKKLTAYMAKLDEQGISLSYSTPDLVVLDISKLPATVRQHFSAPIKNLAAPSQQRMASSREVVEGLVTPSDVVLACGLKTSIRSDRMFQFLFEANAWKFIWRRVFGLPACPYHSLTTQTFGADPARLRSIDFSGLGGADTATRAIDSVTQIASPDDIKRWFGASLAAAVHARAQR